MKPAVELAITPPEALLRVLLDSALDAVVSIDHHGRIVEFNSAAERLFGYRRADVVGRDMAELIVPPELRDAHRRGLAEATANGAGKLLGSRIEIEAMRADGSRFDVELAVSCIPGTVPPIFTGTMRDISKRKRAEQALRDSEARFRNLISLSSDMYWEQDDQYRFTLIAEHAPDHVSAARKRLLGKTRWEGARYFNMSAEDWAAHRAVLDARQPFRDLELGRVTDAGRKLWVSVSGEPIFDAEGLFKGYRGIGKDITERKRAEQLRHLEHTVMRSVATAQTASDVIGGAIRAICEAEGWECGRYFAVDREAGALTLMICWGVDDPVIQRFLESSRQVTYGPGAGLAGRVWQSGQPLWASDITVDPRVAQSGIAREAGMRGAFVFPVPCAGGIVGVLAFNSRTPREPEPELLDAIHVIGSQIGQFVERTRAEEDLRRSEARFRGLAELSSDMYWEQDEHYRFKVLNKRGAMIEGHGPEIGRCRWDVRYFNMSPEAWAAHRAVLEAHQPFRDLELGRFSADGSQVWVSVSGEPMFSADGRFAGYRGVGTDITARKREERLLVLEQRVASELVQARSAESGLRAVLQAICRTEGWECGRYFALDGKPDAMVLVQSWHDGSEAIARYIELSARLRIREGEGLVGQCWTRAEPLWCADVLTSPHAMLPSEASGAGIRAAFFFPLVFEGAVRGVIAIGSSRVQPPDERLLHTMRTVASQLGQFLERKRAEVEQRREERLLTLEHSISRRLADAASEAEGVQGVLGAICESEGWACGRYFALDERTQRMRFAGAWTDGSPALTEFAETSAAVAFARGEGLVGHAWECGRPLWVPDASQDPRVLFKARAMSAGLHSAFLFPVTFNARTVGVISFSSRHVHEPDERLLKSLDVAAQQLGQFLQRKRGEEAVQCQAARLSRLVLLQGRLAEPALELQQICDELVETTQEMLGSGVAALQFIEGDRFVYFSAGKGARHLVGVRTGLQGNFSAAVLESAGPTRCDDTLADPRIDGEAARRAGARSLIGAPLHHEGRVIGVLKMISDAPAAFDDEQLHMLQVLAGIGGSAIRRKQAEAAVAASEARFRSTFELAASGIAHVSLDRRFLRVNRRLCEMLGYDESELVGRPVKAFSHPEDVNLVDDPRDRLLRGEAASVHTEKRYLRKDGRPLWVRLTIALVGDRPGEPQYEVAIFDDITERKAAEDALLRFRTALDGSVDMVFLVDLQSLRLVDFNGTAASYLGYRREELVGMRPDYYLADVTEADLRESFRELLAMPGRADSMVRAFRRKDGHTFQAEVLRRIIDSPDGPILVVNARDLTERNLLEGRQAVYVRHQEEIARFGATALEKRDPGALVDEALRSAVEGVRADAVAYVERGEQGGLVLKGLLGVQPADAELAAHYATSNALALALEHGEASVAEGPGTGLPYGWADAFHSTLLVPVRAGEAVQGALCALAHAPGAFGAEESKFLVTAGSVLSAGLRRIESEGRLAFLAQFDPLTGLPNRALLSDRFAQMIVQAGRHGTQLGALFIDLDQFKVVNDTLGHSGGDDLLKEAARRLQAAVRPGDTVARISGDEFAVILNDLARADDAAMVAQKILEGLGAPLQVLGQEVFVSASIGIAVFPSDGSDAESLIAAADAAMYRAKQSGRNGYQFFTSEINQRTRARAQLAADLRRALEREEFALAYQPKFDLRTGKPCAAEALLRWRRPEGTMVSPAEFIPVLEETGLIVPVGEWVVGRACRDLKAWQEAGLRTLPVAVNLSARQFRQQDLDARIKAIVSEAGVSPELIELEITESQLMHDPDRAVRMVRALHDAGIRIAVDDFGTGYSSLSYLTRFAMSSLKIDRSFVANLLSDQAAAAIVRTIVDMAHTLGFTVVAEGVETEGQAAFLRGLGCDQAQGYLFARPMPAADLASLMAPPRPH